MGKTVVFLRAAAAGLLILLGVTLVQATSTIQFSASTFNVTEGEPAVAISVHRTNDLATVVSVDLMTQSTGSAVAGEDYLDPATKLVFQANETNKVVVVAIIDDGTIEPSESFRLVLTNLTDNAMLGVRSSATVRITDNDKGLQLELPAYSVNEDASVLNIRVVRQDNGNFPVSVECVTTNLTATPGQDYTELAATLDFAAGETFKTVTVPLLNDVVAEAAKTFRIALRNPSARAGLSAPNTATVTITDTDGVIQFESARLTTREESSEAEFAITRGESALTSTVEITTADLTATAGEDYAGLTNVLSFVPGERLKTVKVPIHNDGLKESGESFRVALANPKNGAVLGANRTLSVTIQDNDPGVGFELPEMAASPDQEAVVVNVVRGNDGWLGAFSVQYETLPGTAGSGINYEQAAGTLNFDENELVKRIPIVLLRDSSGTGSKTFSVILTNLTGELTLGRASTRITLANSSLGRVEAPRAAVAGQISRTGERAEIRWTGPAMVSRARSVTGPWEELGSVDPPYLARTDLPGTFYRLRSARTVRLYVPSAYDNQRPLPLVVVLHGYSGSGAGYLDYFRMEALAESRQFLVCHPDGTVDRQSQRFWNATEACCDFYGTGIDDSSYLRGLIEEVARSHAVDRKRIYVMGHSNGGYMSYRMAADHADLVAGIASLAGLSYLDFAAHRPSEPVHILQVHGSADEVVPYTGGALVGGLPVVAVAPGAIATVQAWAVFNGCQGLDWNPEPSMNLDLDVPGLDTTVMRYTNNPPGGAVELWTIRGGRHGPLFFRGAASSEFSTRVIDWLLAHPKP